MKEAGINTSELRKSPIRDAECFAAGYLHLPAF